MKVLGNGGAGIKAVESLVKAGAISVDECLLINSTIKDVPANLEALFVNIGEGTRGGCGKERPFGHELALHAIRERELGESIDKVIGSEDENVAIVTSAEGGTGSGGTPIITEFVYDELEVNPHVFIFTGFEDDARGMANTIDLFKELPPSAIVRIIRNKTYLDEAKGSYIAAEQLANNEFMKQFEIISGNTIKDSFQNMDDTDLYKAINCPGYSIVLSVDLPRTLSTAEQIDEHVKNYINKELHTFKNDTKKCARLGVILSVSEANVNININRKYPLIAEEFGNAFEKFTHIQVVDEDKQNITFIISGMDMPQREINSIYDRYKEEFSSINTNVDSFSDNKQKLDTSVGAFDSMSGRRRRSSSPVTEKKESKFSSKYKSQETVEVKTGKGATHIPKNVLENL